MPEDPYPEDKPYPDPSECAYCGGSLNNQYGKAAHQYTSVITATGLPKTWLGHAGCAYANGHTHLLVPAHEDWRAEALDSSEVWAIRETLSQAACYTDAVVAVLDGQAREMKRPEGRDAHLTEYLIGKCEKNSVPVERCRRLLDILDLDASWTEERLARYHPAT